LGKRAPEVLFTPFDKSVGQYIANETLSTQIQ
jgi:hypothetical protein